MPNEQKPPESGPKPPTAPTGQAETGKKPSFVDQLTEKMGGLKEGAKKATLKGLDELANKTIAGLLTGSALKKTEEETWEVWRARLEAAKKDTSKLGFFEQVAFMLIEFKDELMKTIPEKFKSLFEDVDDGDPQDDIKETDPKIAEKAPEGIRRKIVEKAVSVIGSMNFRGSDVEWGNLACAKVITYVLKKCGLLDKEYLNVAETVPALKEKGWKSHQGPPKPGDIVVYDRTHKTEPDGEIVLGHGHIGIVIDENRIMSNSSKTKMPRVHAEEVWLTDKGNNEKYKRGIVEYLSPPEIPEALVV